MPETVVITGDWEIVTDEWSVDDNDYILLKREIRTRVYVWNREWIGGSVSPPTPSFEETITYEYQAHIRAEDVAENEYWLNLDSSTMTFMLVAEKLAIEHPAP